MPQLLIIDGNTPNLPPAAAAFEHVLSRFGAKTSVARPYVSPVTSDDLDGVDGVIFTGSGVPWATDAAEGKPQRDAMEIVFAGSRPTWGSCNGMQLAAVVLGGSVGASPNGIEVGVARNARRSGEAHAMFVGRDTTWDAPCIHRDEVQRLPQGATLTATNDHSPIQAFAYAKDGIDFWGTQYHPELDLTQIADYLRNQDGIFGEYAHMVPDLDAAEQSPDAAQRLGTRTEVLGFDNRTIELANWSMHVQNQARLRELRARYSGASDFIFGDSPDLSQRLIDLVAIGKKTATCDALHAYHAEKEPLPKPLDYAIVTSWTGTPVLVIQTKTVDIIRFSDVTWDFAGLEGEDETLDGWQRGHRAYFERNGGFDPQMELVCETFELVADLR